MGQFQRVKSMISGFSKMEHKEFEKLLSKQGAGLKNLAITIIDDVSISKTKLLGESPTHQDRLKLNELISRLDWLLLEFISDWPMIQLGSYPKRVKTYFIQLKSILHTDILQFRGHRNDSMDILNSVQRSLEEIESFELLYLVLRKKRRYISQYGSSKEIKSLDMLIDHMLELTKYNSHFEGYRNRLFDAALKSYDRAKLEDDIQNLINEVRSKKYLLQYYTTQRYVAFLEGVCFFYKHKYEESLMALHTAYRVNLQKDGVYLYGIHTITLVNMGLCLINLFKIRSAKIVIEKFMDLARLPQDQAIGFYLLAKTYWLSGSFSLNNEIKISINKYVGDRLIDKFTKIKLQIVLIISDSFDKGISDTSKVIWRNLSYSGLKLEDELAFRILRIQLELMFAVSDDLAVSQIESLRKKLERSREKLHSMERWKIISKILSSLSSHSFDYGLVYKTKFSEFQKLANSVEAKWTPTSLEFLPFERWFECMADGKPYSHPTYLQEKKPADYTKAEARVSLR